MSDVALLCEAIRQKHDAHVDRAQYRQDHPRASSIGECSREIYYQMTEWERRPPPTIELAHRFQRGRDVEKWVTRQLLDDGWDVCETNVPFEIRENLPNYGEQIILTGHCDGRIKWNGAKPVFDVKSLNPNIWNRVNSIGDFMTMGGFWAHYPRQILIYAYQYNESGGLLLLDDCLGHWKPIPVVLEDYLDETESALRKCKEAKVARLRGSPPPFHHDPAACLKCWAREAGVCFPPMSGGHGIRIIEDAELAEALLVMEQTEEAAKDYEAAKRRTDEQFKALGAGQYIVDDFLVKTKEQAHTSYPGIPQELKEPYKVVGKSYRTTFERLDHAGDGVNQK